ALCAGHFLRHRFAESGVVRSAKDETVDNSFGEALQNRIAQRQQNPDDDRDPDRNRIVAEVVLREDGNLDADVESGGDRDERKERDRSLEKEIGERESKIEIENREDQRNRGVMTDRFDEPRFVPRFGVT